MNEIAQLNCIFERLTQTWRLKKLNELIVKVRIFNINIIRSIKTYVAKMKIRDNEKKKHTSMQIFYAFSKIIHEIIVDLFWMMKINLFVNWHSFIWQFELDKNKIVVDFFEKFFAKTHKKRAFIYALICNIKNFDETLKLIVVF